MKIVLTGGPHAGKTTLVEALAARGHAVVPEAALSVIAGLRKSMGDAAASTWRSENLAQFQVRIAEQQLRVEQDLGPGRTWFLDRGLPDGLAYCRDAGIEAPAELMDAIEERRYDLVLWCELVRPFRPRTGSGRLSDEARALRLGQRLLAVYTEYGYAPVRIPCVSVEERLALVLAAVERRRAELRR